MINKTLFINWMVWYGQTNEVHINPSYLVKTTPMVLGGELNE